MRHLELKLFGHPEFILDGKPIDQLVSAKARALFIYLALSGKPHSRLEIATFFWSDKDDANALRNLRVALTRLNQLLGEFILVIGRRELAINPGTPIWIDVHEFNENSDIDNPTLSQMETAVQLYQGHFLEGFQLKNAEPFEEWVWEFKERYRTQIMALLSRLGTHYAQQKKYHRSITYLNRLLTLEPWSEETHQQLMRLYAWNNQRSAALNQYEQCKQILEKEFGEPPSNQTQALYQQIVDEEIEPDLPETAVPIPISEGVPFQAPTRIPTFVGRTSLTDKTVGTFDETPNSVQAIVGMGGVGKSALAIELAHLAKDHFADGVLWANVASGEPMSIIERWAQVYGYDFSRIGDLENMSAAFRDMLTDKSVLIVLDDVRIAARIRPLLPNGPNNHVIFTTRDHDLARTLNATVYPLQELSEENGRLLLTNILGDERVEAEPEAATEICQLLQYLPLAVEITANRLRSRTRRQLSDIAERLRDETQRLSLLEISDQAVKASFTISWESLDQAHRRLFSILGLFNGRSFSPTAIADIAELDRYVAEDRLFNLAALSLVREETDNRYRQHPLLADFAKEQLGEDEKVNGRYVQHYLNFAQQNQTNYDALRPEWENMMAAVESAMTIEERQIITDFTEALENAWFTRGRYSQARKVYKWAIQPTNNTQSINVKAKLLRQLGLACLEQRDFNEAKQHLLDSNKIYQRINEVKHVAQNLSDLARISIELSEYALAKEFLQSSHTLRNKINDSTGLAETTHVEARMNYFLGQYDKTIQFCHRTLELLDYNKSEESHKIRTLSLLASTYNILNHLEKAQTFAESALILCQKFHSKGDEGVVLNVLCSIKRKQDQFEVALEYGNRGLKLLENVGDLGSQAMLLYQLARISQVQKNYDLAIKFGLRSLELCQISHFNLQMAWILIRLTECYEELGQFEVAQEKWLQTWELAQSLQNPTLLDKVKERPNYITHIK